MIHGADSPMQLGVKEGSVDELVLQTPFKSTWQVDLWSLVFDSLLNPGAADKVSWSGLCIQHAEDLSQCLLHADGSPGHSQDYGAEAGQQPRS
jgi:hypothetical protein